VATFHEEIAAAVRGALRRAAPATTPVLRSAPLAVVTGAGGMLGRQVAAALASRGFRVRGIGRSGDPADPNVHEWRRLDLSAQDAAPALAGADVVIHAAAATSGGYDSHQRHSIDGTRRLLAAMARADVQRLVYISSLSVLDPPRSARECQHEHTPLARNARALGPYTWGKCEAERAVAAEAPGLNIDTRIVRPGALIDWRDPEIPGLAGRRLFGDWHLGLGRPGLPIAIYGVGEAAAAIAWMAEQFDQAPAVVNLVDGATTTRAALLERMRANGWHGRVLWAPIRPLAAAMWAARMAFGLARGSRPERLDAWSVLRPRRFDTRVADTLAQDATARPRSVAEATRDPVALTLAAP
jgi:nucleoside-diphosphate-sugar epimerase